MTLCWNHHEDRQLSLSNQRDQDAGAVDGSTTVSDVVMQFYQSASSRNLCVSDYPIAFTQDFAIGFQFRNVGVFGIDPLPEGWRLAGSPAAVVSFCPDANPDAFSLSHLSNPRTLRARLPERTQHAVCFVRRPLLRHYLEIVGEHAHSGTRDGQIVEHSLVGRKRHVHLLVRAR